MAIFMAHFRQTLTETDAYAPVRGGQDVDQGLAPRLVLIDGVRQQVDQDLIQACAIGFDTTLVGEARVGNADAALMGLRFDHHLALENDVD
jgi:hypothetical protein